MMFSGSWKEVVAWLGLELTDPISWAVLSRRICGRLSTPPSPGIHEYHPEGLLKTLIAGPSPRASDSVGLGCGLRMYISNKFLEMLLLLTGEHPLRTTA